jgi:hypothetical protein
MIVEGEVRSVHPNKYSKTVVRTATDDDRTPAASAYIDAEVDGEYD